MKQKILSALQTKFEGVDAKILDKIATRLSKTVTTEDEVSTAVDGVTFADVLTTYGDSRANDAQATAIKNYEKKHGLKDGKAVKVESDDEPGNEEPAWFAAFRKQNQEQIDALVAENNALKTERARAERTATISAKAKELGIPEYLMKRITIADDADVDAELNSLKQDLVDNSLLGKVGGLQTRTDAQYEAEADSILALIKN